jgi:hypothetical protein
MGEFTYLMGEKAVFSKKFCRATVEVAAFLPHSAPVISQPERFIGLSEKERPRPRGRKRQSAREGKVSTEERAVVKKYKC